MTCFDLATRRMCARTATVQSVVLLFDRSNGMQLNILTAQPPISLMLLCSPPIITRTLSVCLHIRLSRLITQERKGIESTLAETFLLWQVTARHNYQTRSPAVAEGPHERAVSWNLVKYCTNVRWIALEKACKRGMTLGNDLQGHSRSLTLVPFDRPHTISY